VRLHDWVEVGDFAPAWLWKLAECVGAYHLNEKDVAAILEDAPERLAQLRAELGSNGTQESLVGWGRWFLADRTVRGISPHSRVPAREFAAQLVTVGSVDTLREAIKLDSNNPEYYRQLAALVEDATPETAALYRKIAATLSK
jgi:hypothetical protein